MPSLWLYSTGHTDQLSDVVRGRHTEGEYKRGGAGGVFEGHLGCWLRHQKLSNFWFEMKAALQAPLVPVAPHIPVQTAGACAGPEPGARGRQSRFLRWGTIPGKIPKKTKAILIALAFVWGGGTRVYKLCKKHAVFIYTQM